MKTILVVTLLAKVFFCLAEPQQLSPGDIAIIGFNFRDPDEFSFITFTNLTAGTKIHFTDCGWKSNNSFRENEGIVTYTTPAEGVEAMTVLTYGKDPGFTTSGVGGFFGFSLDGDQIIAYQGDFDLPEFIYAINNNGSDWQTDAIDNNSSVIPSGLIPGYTAVALSESNNQVYDCHIETGTRDELLSAISNPLNWTGSSTRFEFPPSCFEGSLPVTILLFTINVQQQEVCFHLDSEKDNTADLEYSENGIEFTKLQSFTIHAHSQILNCYFITNFAPGYYRLKMNENNILYYSQILFASANSSQPEKIEVLTIEGKVLTEVCCDEDLKNYLNQYNQKQLFIIKRYYPDRIETGKFLQL